MGIGNFNLLVFDLAGIFVFAIGGATIAVRRGLDLFGVLVLACVAATAGGIMRDVLIGASPPAAFQEWSYFAVACVAGLLVFWRMSLFERLNHPVQLFDAAGLALFAVAGASKALAFGLGPVPSVLMGMLTAVGGGMLRDVLIADVPHVLYKELYAVAALSGAIVVVAAHVLGLPELPSALAAGTLCFALRFMGIRYGWRLPVSQRGDPPA
ncbi:MAG: trimeric intracellular cation channel family protein [Gammaproteobacteria bacterium]